MRDLDAVVNNSIDTSLFRIKKSLIHRVTASRAPQKSRKARQS